jgi:hypothetical protein
MLQCETEKMCKCTHIYRPYLQNIAQMKIEATPGSIAHTTDVASQMNPRIDAP